MAGILSGDTLAEKLRDLVEVNIQHEFSGQMVFLKTLRNIHFDHAAAAPQGVLDQFIRDGFDDPERYDTATWYSIASQKLGTYTPIFANASKPFIALALLGDYSVAAQRMPHSFAPLTNNEHGFQYAFLAGRGQI